VQCSKGIDRSLGPVPKPVKPALGEMTRRLFGVPPLTRGATQVKQKFFLIYRLNQVGP
jgi:hypothetical protein